MDSRKKEILTYRSCLGMLKHLRKLALRTDPNARIMQLSGEYTLVVHLPKTPILITVRQLEEEV